MTNWDVVVVLIVPFAGSGEWTGRLLGTVDEAVDFAVLGIVALDRIGGICSETPPSLLVTGEVEGTLILSLALMASPVPLRKTDGLKKG